MPPLPGSRWRVARRRGFRGDPYWEKRDDLVAEPNTLAAKVGTLYDNFEIIGEDAFDLVGGAWVPSPLNPANNAEVTWTVGPATPSVTSLTEVLVTCSIGVTTWLTPGSRFFCTDSGVGKVFIVTAVGGATASLLGLNGQAPLVAIDAASAMFSNQRTPPGFNMDPAVWRCQYASGGSATGVPMPGGGAWTSVPGAALVRVPAGLWLIEYDGIIGYGVRLSEAASPGEYGVNVGLANIADGTPAADLWTHDDDRHDGNRPWRQFNARLRATRNHAYSGAATLYQLGVQSGTGSHVDLSNDVRPARIHATSLLL